MGNADSVPKNWGFKVIELVNQSPGQKAGLIVGSDFILTVNGRKLRRLTAEQIKDLVQSNEDQEATLKVLNIETGKIRELLITPTRKWPGDGLLGVKIRLAPYGDDLKKLEQTVAANVSLFSQLLLLFFFLILNLSLFLFIYISTTARQRFLV